MRIAGADDVGQRISRYCSLSHRRERAYSYPLSTAPSLAAAATMRSEIPFSSSSVKLLSPGCSTTSSASDFCPSGTPCPVNRSNRSEEHTSELQSLMRISYAVFCLKKKIKKKIKPQEQDKMIKNKKRRIYT